MASLKRLARSAAITAVGAAAAACVAPAIRVAPAQLVASPSLSERLALSAGIDPALLPRDPFLGCTIATDGKRKDCRVTASSEVPPKYRDAALRMAGAYTFSPARQAGQPIESSLALPLAATRPMNKDGVIVTLAEMIQEPTDADYEAALPEVARFYQIAGFAIVSCSIDVDGVPRDCSPVEESTAGLGVGDAAVKVAERMRFRPATHDGKPIKVTQPVTISFGCPVACPSRAPAGVSRTIVRATWAKAPRQADVDAAWRSVAGQDVQGGGVRMYCDLTAAGQPSDCRAVAQTSPDPRLAQAAALLTSKFALDYRVAAGLPADAGVYIPISFSGDATEPDLMLEPTQQTIRGHRPPGLAEGRSKVAIACSVMDAGMLRNCHVASESIPGVGLGEAALRLAPYFRASAWTPTGQPSSGTEVHLKLDFDARTTWQSMDSMESELTRSGSTLVQPDWERMPAAESLWRSYPAPAVTSGEEGHVRLMCDVNAAGGVANCRVVSEAPLGRGFGDAALRLASEFAMKPASLDGVSVSGATVMIPIRFVFP